MSFWDYLIIAIIVAWAVFSIFFVKRHKKCSFFGVCSLNCEKCKKNTKARRKNN